MKAMLSLQESIELLFRDSEKELQNYLALCATMRSPFVLSMNRHASLSEPQKSIAQIAEVLARDLYTDDLEQSAVKAEGLYALLKSDPEKINHFVKACQIFANPGLRMPLRLSMVFVASGLVYEFSSAKGIVSFDAILTACFYTGCFAGIQTELCAGKVIAQYAVKGAKLLDLYFSERSIFALSGSTPLDSDDSPHKPGSAWRDLGYR